jgi:hypothetical protein
MTPVIGHCFRSSRILFVKNRKLLKQNRFVIKLGSDVMGGAMDTPKPFLYLETEAIPSDPSQFRNSAQSS